MKISPFTILAEPSRRQILNHLALQPASVGELVAASTMSQPVVSKHLRTLRDAGFVEVRPEGQRRIYSINPTPLREVDEWLMPYRKFWAEKLDALERHLDDTKE